MYGVDPVKGCERMLEAHSLLHYRTLSYTIIHYPQDPASPDEIIPSAAKAGTAHKSPTDFVKQTASFLPMRRELGIYLLYLGVDTVVQGDAVRY